MSCPAPFLDPRDFSGGGFVDGRLCGPNMLVANDPDAQCCLPCPVSDFIYPQSFVTWYRAAESVNVSGVVLCLFLLLSYAFLPVEKTKRHYLSVCLVVSIMALALGFVVPLAVMPPQCFDRITPNDMFSSVTCAWSGALIIAGGVGVTVFIFIRVLSMHLQVCWDVQPGRKFFYGSQGAGWLFIAAIFTVTITLTGVSFRFGDACHVNSRNSMADLWGPLLVIAGLATVMQLATFGYCLHVYIKNLWSDDKSETTNSTGLRSQPSSSIRVQSARAVYHRVSKIIWLQWRSILIVVFILVDVIFLAIVFISLNEAIDGPVKGDERIMDWLFCLVEHPHNTEQCVDLGQQVVLTMGTVNAVLILLSLAGIQTFLLHARWAMFTGWVELVRAKVSGRSEFVSLDARRHSQAQARSYEMKQLGLPTETRTVVSPVLASPTEVFKSPYGSIRQDHPPDYFSSKEVRSPAWSPSPPHSPPPREPLPRSPPSRRSSPPPGSSPASPPQQRMYRTPSHSFSSPRAPSLTSRVEWDPTSTYARGGLGLNPPSSAHEDADIERGLGR